MNYPYNKVTGCLCVCMFVCMFVCVFVCLYRRISLTAEPIRFSFTGQLFIGPEKVYNYLGEGYHHPPREIVNGKKWLTQNIIYKSGLEYFPNPQLVLLEASKGVAALATYKIFVYILKHMENHKIVICNLCSSFLLSEYQWMGL